MSMVVHMIGNAHVDPVWLWQWQAGLDEALASFRSAADRCDEYPDFIYTRGEAWLYQQVEDIDPDLFARIKDLVWKGRWKITGGQWVQPDTNLPTGEAWRQQILHGQRYFQERFGIAPRTGYNVDSFGHPATLPDLLGDLGYRGYVFHRPSPEQVALPAQTFRWRGPRGGELLGFRIAPCYVTRSGDLYGQIMLSVEAGDVTLGHTMCFYGVGNHGGGPTKANIEYILGHQHTFPGIELRFSDPESFFDEVEPHRASLPVVEQELQHTFPGCYSVMHDIKQKQRRGEHLLESAGRMIEVFGGGGEEKLREINRLDAAWKDLLFTQFHDILSGTSIDPAWDSVRAMQGRAFISGEEVIARVSRRWTRQALPPVNQQQIVLLNPLPYEWRGWVEWEPFLDFDLWRDRWLSLMSGEGVDFQEMQPSSQLSHFHRIFFPVQIPAQGCLQLLLRDDPRPEPSSLSNRLRVSPTLLANDRVEIALHSGGIRSIRQGSREMLGAEGLTLTLREDLTDTWTFHFDRFEGDIQETLKGGIWKIEESGPLRARVSMETFIGHSRLRWTMSLNRDEAQFSMSLEIIFQERQRILQMPVHLASNPISWTDGLPGGWMNREPDASEWPVQNWSRLQWKDAGLAAITGDAYSLSCRHDCWQWTLLRSPKMACDGNGPDVYSGHDTFTDQGVHRFDFCFLLETQITPEQLEIKTACKLQPPVVLDRYEGMNRPPWKNNCPKRLWTGAEQRAGRAQK